MDLTLKHQWNSRQRHILLYFKAFCRRGVPDFHISMDDMLFMQRRMACEMKELGRRSEFYTFWKYFGRSGFSGDLRNNETALLKNVFIQTALGVLTTMPVLEQQFRSDLYSCGCELFSRRYPYSDIEKLKITLRDTKILDLALQKDAAQVKLMYDLARNRECKLKNVYHILLNYKEYGTLMQVNDLCGHLEEIDVNALESHFYEPSQDEGKVKFNGFFMEHFPGRCTGAFWKRHRTHDNLSSILLPALERGFSPDRSVLTSSGGAVNLHSFLSFTDELRDILTMPAYKDVFKRFQEDVKCADLYFKYLEKKQQERNNNETPVE